MSLTMNMSEIYQLILAGNGAGKSSLLGELSPNPADADDYVKDGKSSKIIVIIDNNREYKTASYFGKKTLHSFQIDGVELNDGGTVSVQRKLVLEHLRYNQERHDLNIGRITFSEMSTNERRKWFIQFSPIPFDYALGVYAKFKEQYSIKNGALKNARKRLAQEISEVVSEEEQLKLQQDVEQLQAELEFLQGNRSPIQKTSQQLKAERFRNLDAIEAVSITIIRMQSIDRPDDRRYTLLEVDERIAETRHKIAVNETLIKQAVGEHSKLVDTMEILKKTGNEGIASLQAKADAVQAERTRLAATRRFGLDVFDPVLAINAVDSVTEPLVAVFTELPSNEDRRYTQASFTQNKELYEKLRESHAKLTSYSNTLRAKKAQMDEHKSSNDVTCPKCSYQWVVGHSEEVYAELMTVVERNTSQIEDVKKQMDEVSKLLAEFEDYRRLYAEYSRTMRGWSVLNPFWDYLTDNQTAIKFPRQVPTLLAQFRADLDIELEMKKHQDHFFELTKLRDQAEQVGGANLTEVTQKVEACDERISGMTKELMTHKNKLNDYTQYRRQVSEMLALGARLQDMLDGTRKASDEEAEALRREAIHQCILAIQIALAKKSEALAAIATKKIIIDDLVKHIELYAVQEATLKQLISQISPTEGLIAECLMGSIKNFTTQMNNVIRKIWSYPLKVMECRVETTGGDELDYKFPVMVDKPDNVTPDVKLCSTAQREVINMVFKVTALRHLGLSTAPLFLDEFGASFDIDHRFMAAETVKALMETMQFSQLFMISHYETTYGSFSNAEVCVLDPRGINVPSEYNTHVTIV